jgi:hypothetical protein
MSSSAVDVAPVLDAKHDHLAPLLVDAVENTVSTSAGRVDTAQLTLQRLADSTRLPHERRGEELDHRRRNGLWQALGERASCWRRDD